MGKDASFRPGSGATTKIDLITPNRQKNHGTLGVKGTDWGQLAYRLECLKCGFVYGANGSDIHDRKCPACQGGRPGIPYSLTEGAARGLNEESVSKGTPRQSDDEQVMAVLRQVKQLAQAYRALTGKPLGVTGEIAELEAARILKVKLAPARTPGFDATEEVGGRVRKVQIKGRCLLPDCKPSQRVGSIDVKKDFDAVLLVLLDENFDAVAIHEAPRKKVIEALEAPGSKSRNERGSLGVSKFRSISSLRWSRATSVSLRYPPNSR